MKGKPDILSILVRGCSGYLAREGVLGGRICSVQEQLVNPLLCKRWVLAHAWVPSHVPSVQNHLHDHLHDQTFTGGHANHLLLGY